VQEREVGEEVFVDVDLPLDGLQLGQLLLGPAPALLHLGPQGLRVGLAPEEELQQEPITSDGS
jgi:hypothetical protein